MNLSFPSALDELRQLPHVEVVSEQENHLCLHVAGRTLPLRIVTRASGYPRDVRQAVWQAQQEGEQNDQLLLCVPSLSPGSREWLQQEGIGYLDGQGNLFLSAEGVYILRDSEKKPPKSTGVVETNIFRGRAAQVLHTLLHTPKKQWHLTALADEAGVASGTALRVCETLEKLLLMERKGRGPHSLRGLVEPGKLLDAWAENHRIEAASISGYYRLSQRIETLAGAIGKTLEEQGIEYAITLASGALYRAPFLTHVGQLALWLPEGVDLERIAADCQLKPVEDGFNVRLLSARSQSPLMYRQKAGDLWLANDIQMYLDLMAWKGGRNKEQAEHLRRERIGF